jgi:hypothetical protein
MTSKREEQIIEWAENRERERAAAARAEQERLDREREEREEAESRREREQQQLATIHDPQMKLSARVIREFVRGTLVAPAAQRLYNIGMGIEKFPVVVPNGDSAVKIIDVPAPPAVQVKALTAIIQVGVPPQAAPLDTNAEELPGVLVLGEDDVDSARQLAHGERYVPPERRLSAFAEAVGEPSPTMGAYPSDPGVTTSGIDPTMQSRVEAGEFELVEVDETPDSAEATRDDRGATDASPPVPPPDTASLAKQILARRRARRANGNGAHAHPDPRRD